MPYWTKEEIQEKIDSEGFDYFFSEYVEIDDLPEEIHEVYVNYLIFRDRLEQWVREED